MILSFIGKNNMMAIMTSRLLDIPVVVSVRGEPAEEYYSPLLKTAAGFLFRFAAGVVFPVENEGGEKEGGLPEKSFESGVYPGDIRRRKGKTDRGGGSGGRQ